MTTRKKHKYVGDIEIENTMSYTYGVRVFVHIESVTFAHDKNHWVPITPQIVIENGLIRLCKNPVYEIDCENSIICYCDGALKEEHIPDEENRVCILVR